MLKAATWYLKKGYSVIPVRDDKKPYIKWQGYQKKMPSEKQIKEWWQKWPEANIGLVTGEISNLTVIDIDSDAGRRAIEEITPDNFLTPTATTPSGGEHRYCEYDERIRNSVQFLQDCDVRSEGGYIIAPPSKNGRGEYKWVDGLSIAGNTINKLPYLYIKHILSYIKREGWSNKEQQSVTYRNIGFKKGQRDETIFHLANHLVKSNMPDVTIREYLSFIASKCDPPYPQDEILVKIQSVIDRVSRSDKGMTETVRRYIKQQEGNISLQNLAQELQSVTSAKERAKLRVIVKRMVDEGLLMSTGKRAGEYRIIKHDIIKADWKNAKTESMEFSLPLGLHECVRVVPSSMLCFAGMSNSGKTGLAMGVARYNCQFKPVKYFSSEISQEDFKERAQAHSPLDKWNVDLLEGWEPQDLSDLLDPHGINIIDYLEPPQGDYTQMVPVMRDIHKALQGGIVVVCIQKKGEGPAMGGGYMQNKPHLFVTMDVQDWPVYKMYIAKCKAFNKGFRNPTGLSCDYKIGKNGIDILGYGKFGFSRWDEGE